MCIAQPQSPLDRRGTEGDVNRLKFQSPCIPLLQGGFREEESPFSKGDLGGSPPLHQGGFWEEEISFTRRCEMRNPPLSKGGQRGILKAPLANWAFEHPPIRG